MKLYLYILVLLPVLCFTSCDRNSDDWNGDGHNWSGKVSFAIGIGEQSLAAQLRVATGSDFKSSWETGDEIGLYIVKGSAGLQPSGNYANNVKLTRQASGSWQTDAGSEIYYPNDGGKLSFYGYYPYQSTIMDATAISFSVLANQTSANYNQSDLLLAKTLNVAKSNNAVHLQFAHALSLIEVVVLQGPNIPSFTSDFTVALQNVHTGVQLNWENALTASGNTTNIIMHKVAGMTDTYRALLPAQTLSGGAKISFTQTTAGQQINMHYTDATLQTLTASTVKKYQVTLGSTEYYPAPHAGWAGSNIYWDGSKLTFDDVGFATNKTYQGVFFQWGSLYGIAPANNSWSPYDPIYLPAGSTSTLYSLGFSSWKFLPGVAGDPKTNNPPLGKTERDRAYLYEVTNGATGIGDICKHLTDKGWAPSGKKWRMPTSMELGPSGSYSGFIPGAATSGNNAGTNSVRAGRAKTSTGSPFLPASGYRDSDTGMLTLFGSFGFYWSGSPANTPAFTSGYCLYYSDSALTTDTALPRSYAFSVRCVAEP